MNLATWSMRNPIPAILLFVVLTLAGLFGFHRLTVQQWPDVRLPVVGVTLVQPGVAPAQLETEVVREVENALASLKGVKHVSTTITEGQVKIYVQFELEKSLSDALIETKNAVDSVRAELPADVQEPIVSALSDDDPVLVYAVASTQMSEEALSWYIDDTLAKTLFAIDGVGTFNRVGGVQRQVRVRVDPAQMAALSITALDVSQALRSMQQQSSGGQTKIGQKLQSVRTIATVHEAADLGTFPITLANGRQVRLDQFSTVSDGVEDRSTIALRDGKPVVGFSVSRAEGYDEVHVAADVQAALATLAAKNPDLRFVKVGGTVDDTIEQYDGSMHMLYEGAILAVLVVWWFLRDGRATLIAASALPLSIFPVFAAMAWLGFSLNTISLLALAVVVGILVDDAIVEIENIERHLRMGKPRRQAVTDAVQEIALPVIATTMTLVAVFLPTSMMSGVTGLYFRQFGWTAVIAVLASLLVARVLTPMLAASLLKHGREKTRQHGRGMRLYMSAVQWCLHHRGITLAATIVLFIGSVALVPLIPGGLLPPTNNDRSTINFSLPPGSSLNDAVATAEAARARLMTVAGAQHVFVTVGEGTVDTPGEVRSGELDVALAPRGSRPSQTDVESAMRKVLASVPGAHFTVGGSDSGEQLQLVLASDDDTALNATAEALERELRTVGTLANIVSTASVERPELVVRPDPQRASELGVNTAEIGQVVRVATSGDFGINLAKLNLDSRQIGINVSMPEVDIQDAAALGNLRVPTRSGEVPLSSIAAIEMSSSPSQISRYDRRRYITVSADLNGMHLSDALDASYKLPSIRNLPANVALILDGDAETANELTHGFILALVVGVLCVYGVLVLLFRDCLQPVTILSALPLSLGGAFIALLIARSELSVPSMIGLVMLMGIVTKNSILLVEYATVGVRDRAMTLHDALIDACEKRARPIVMTTLAMIAGMLPIACGFGADASFRQPMAIAVIGGLVSSTALSLLVVPVVFTYVASFEKFAIGLFRRSAGAVRRREDPYRAS
jgi:multidrug efflux pump subunit AcrB